MRNVSVVLLLTMMLSGVYAQAIPPEPTLNPVPAPTAAQMEVTMPTASTAVRSADEVATEALAKTYAFTVGVPQSIPLATAQTKTLQQQGVSAFMQYLPNDQVQVWVGPEVDQTHLQTERQQLLVAKVVGVGNIMLYSISS
jgi:cell division septation protein DedD